MLLKVLEAGQTGKNKGVMLKADISTMTKMVAAYDHKYHEAPLTIGKPTDTAPSFGWVRSLKCIGDSLYAELRGVYDKVKSDLQQGIRKVERVSFYPDLSLRHIALSGGKVALPVLPFNYNDNGEFNEFVVDMGGEQDMDNNDPKMKALLRVGDEIMCGLPQKQFSENEDPGEELSRKTMEILLSGREYDSIGNPLSERLDYSTAFKIACKEHPDLVNRYVEQLQQWKENNGKPHGRR